ncbi:MAG: bifunctional tetrahydrofolate synthase/dihydrofolate synthase [Pontibacterium sp.]
MKQVTDQFSLDAWLTWIEQCHPAEIELGLGRVSQVAQRLGVLKLNSRIVTVAGTNGKGSTVTYLEAMLRNAGYTVGCFTSPHFRHYNERVRLNAENVSDEMLCQAFRAINEARGDIALTYFEYGTLAALVIFQQQAPDVVLLEVGLGGRLDAVNIIDADVSVVTSIALDHIDWLGDNREIIGREKCGIFRQDKPAVCGDSEPTQSVSEVAAETGAQLYQVGQQFNYQIHDGRWDWQGVCPVGESLQLTDLPLPGLPLPNAATALQVLAVLGLAVSVEAIHQGLEQAAMTGRMQPVELDNGTCWLDVAHNPEAAGLLAKRLQAKGQDVHLVLGMLGDKDFATVIDILRPQIKHWYLADLNVSRGQKATTLAENLDAEVQAGCCDMFDSVAAALEAARAHLNPDNCLLVAGSFYTVSDALDHLGVSG